ncbi:hypothetical protein [Massilia alkalitolerans]|uniref:hypothetical protein n=1 Tax=Massilia alkalitolerans TaxID=286638 RepID=UPI001E41FD3B|nr:hypothetical protein [Massilia alkalitolerans]
MTDVARKEALPVENLPQLGRMCGQRPRKYAKLVPAFGERQGRRSALDRFDERANRPNDPAPDKTAKEDRQQHKTCKKSRKYRIHQQLDLLVVAFMIDDDIGATRVRTRQHMQADAIHDCVRHAGWQPAQR